jgi:hypothetical protein
MSSKVYALGKQEVLVAASAKIAAWSKAPYKIYQKVGYPNQPDTWSLLKVGAADEEYSSSAFTGATTVRIEASASEVFYAQGTDSVPIERRSYQAQPAPIALDATGPLTAAMIAAGIITSTTAAAVAGTVPTGTVLDAALQMGIGESIDFTVIATGANGFTVTVAAGVTIVGGAVVATATSGRFRLRKTAAATYIIYRLS